LGQRDRARAAYAAQAVTLIAQGHATLMPLPRLTVWYNTRCPVCDAGIDRQRNKLLAAVKAGTIAFRDINLEPDALAVHGASLEDIRRRLHATDEAGRLLVGADVAIAVWRLTPGEGWLAALFGNRAMRPLTRLVYDRFADVLYAWNRRKGHW
jgi:predicted DCC family thiol-disulfide oxidoreductase YuxK